MTCPICGKEVTGYSGMWVCQSSYAHYFEYRSQREGVKEAMTGGQGSAVHLFGGMTAEERELWLKEKVENVGSVD
jgi:hypothetical protein